MTIRRVLAVALAGALMALGAATPSYAAPGDPTGIFTLDRTIAYMRVIDGDQSRPYGEDFRITPSGVTDDETAPDDLVMEVSPDQTSGFTEYPLPCPPDQCKITYDEPGTFTPRVRLTDEDDNSTTVNLATIRVIRDTTAPVVRLTQPRPRLRHRISAWRVIRGTAIDQGVGTTGVDVEVLQKRGARWWFYDAVYNRETDTVRRVWVRGLRSEAATFTRYRPHSHIAILMAGSRWRTAWIKGLTRGPLVVRVDAVDANFWQQDMPRKNAWVNLTRR